MIEIIVNPFKVGDDFSDFRKNTIEVGEDEKDPIISNVPTGSIP